MDDQLATIADALLGLDANERVLVVQFVQQFADLLRTQRGTGGKSRK
ncbi:hypothetical protein [Burkholderia sp. BCC1998]|nr:hypothetical protein [Burkholderia sp. BCC1998]